MKPIKGPGEKSIERSQTGKAVSKGGRSRSVSAPPPSTISKSTTTESLQTRKKKFLEKAKQEDQITIKWLMERIEKRTEELEILENNLERLIRESKSYPRKVLEVVKDYKGPLMLTGGFGLAILGVGQRLYYPPEAINTMNSLVAFASDKFSKMDGFSSEQLFATFFQLVNIFNENIAAPTLESWIVADYLKPLVYGIGNQLSNIDLGMAKEGIMQLLETAIICLSHPITLVIGVIAIAAIAIKVYYVKEAKFEKELSEQAGEWKYVEIGPFFDPENISIDLNLIDKILSRLHRLEGEKLADAMRILALVKRGDRMSMPETEITVSLGKRILQAVVRELPKLEGANLENAVWVFYALAIPKYLDIKIRNSIVQAMLNKDLLKEKNKALEVTYRIISEDFVDKATGNLLAKAVLELQKEKSRDLSENEANIISSLVTNQLADLEVQKEMVRVVVSKNLNKLKNNYSDCLIMALEMLLTTQAQPDFVDKEMGNSMAKAVLELVKTSELKEKEFSKSVLILFTLVQYNRVNPQVGNSIAETVLKLVQSPVNERDLMLLTLYYLAKNNLVTPEMGNNMASVVLEKLADSEKSIAKSILEALEGRNLIDEDMKLRISKAEY